MSRIPSSPRPVLPSRWVEGTSFLLVAVLCLLSVRAGLLPGLLAICLGFGATRALRSTGNRLGANVPVGLAAALVIGAPIALVTWGLFQAKGMTVLALDQYQALLEHMSQTVLDIRQKLPEELAGHLPAGVAAVQEWVAEHLRDRASSLATAGKAWLHGALLAYVGLIVGSLIAATPRATHPGPLTAALRARALTFMSAFSQIVAAQFWIAALNAVLTAVFLLGVLPAFSVTMPYAYPLIAFTFLAGLIPIVGNLLCNVVLTVVGVSVSATVGLSCLLFLIGIHKFEYFINAKVVGRQTRTAAWELLAAMFAAEALFGVAGLVAAPLYYAYLKKELHAQKLI